MQEIYGYNREKIVCACIKYKKKYHLLYDYVFGNTHAECIRRFADMDLPTSKRNMKKEKQGFWTTNGRFVDRKKAKEIALNAGQISPNYDKDVLYSEYISWYAIPSIF